MIKVLIIIIIILLLFLNIFKTSNYESFNNIYRLPKIVWSYWDNDLPDDISRIVKHNTEMLKGWQYIVVNKKNEHLYINPEDKPDSLLIVQHYADWLRLALLEKYGGVWMDISIILNVSLDNLYDKSVEMHSELTGFRAKHFETTNVPVIENWFIMAPLGSEVIHLWLEEFEKAIRMGFLNYKRNAVAHGVDYQHIGTPEIPIFNYTGLPALYFAQHGCMQVVLQNRLSRKPRMYLEDAADSMFKIQTSCNWDKKCIQEKLNDFAYSKNIPYIKLINSDRKALDLSKYFSD